MNIGVLTEIKADEFRVAITPAGVRELTRLGHDVLVQAGAGVGSAIGDLEYEAQGARIVPLAQDVWGAAELVLKVKEPQPGEVALLRPGQTLFTYLHLAAAPELAASLCASGATCIAYETVEDARGRLPLLAPMSEVAGKIATQAGAFMLEKPLGGRGVLLGGVPGVAAANVVVIGGGVVGMNAARMAMGLNAEVVVMERSLPRMREIDDIFLGRVLTRFSTISAVEEEILKADVVIGAVLIPGANAPKMVRREHLSRMKPGSVLVDVSIDQGGCFETSRPTTHSEPVYLEGGVIHYCVTNMPGAVARTSSFALNNATLPFVLELADKGWRRALQENAHLRRGVNVCFGRITHDAVGQALGIEVMPPEEALTM